MTMTYEFNDGLGLIEFTAQDTLTDDQLVACVQAMLADSRTELSMPSLVDLRSVKHLEVTKTGLEAMLGVVRTDGSPVSEAKIAIVTDGANAFIARLLEALASAESTARQYRNFDNLTEARRWLSGEA